VVATLLAAVPGGAPAAEPPATYLAGAASVDITPRYPVRLSGFGFRRAESEGVTLPIRAKALAVGVSKDDPAVLITVDNLGVPEEMVAEVAARLKKSVGLRRERLAVTATHTHTAPMLRGVAPTLFGESIPAAHQEHIDRYTRELTDKLEAVALAALKDRAPARLSYGIGTVGFARNRRTVGGPVDHDLPALVVCGPHGKVRAVYVSYACHCVSLSDNKVSGDWAGYAQERIERDHPGAVALVSIGCGADANPSSGVAGGRSDVAEAQGVEVAREVGRLLDGYLTPVTGELTARVSRFDLPLDTPPTRQQWEERAKRRDAVGHHARVQLARLDRGEALQTKIPYSVQTWAFGDRLALVFLPGEVVADYALRLKRELDPGRLWVNAYANDDPCYIPSERVLKEGGYEGGDAMVYYDRPARLRPGLEEKIVGAVREQLVEKLKAPFDGGRLGGTRPLSPQQSLATLRPREGFVAELVAAEPLVTSPVAIDFGPDGRLWVAEMDDYPTGVDGKFKPGGRVKVMEDTDGDGHYDKATVLLDNIPFPTGVKVWHKGVLVCAAPDILYAEDTDGDGKADVVRKLYSGFATHNYQARVNGLAYGLDNWVYGSGGLFGGDITSFAGGPARPLANRDFRVRPDTGEIEAAAGRAQQGRVRDDWGNWFGCDNSALLRHYPLAEHYLRRNPHVTPPANDVSVPDYPDPTRLYPARGDLQLFRLSGPAGRVTAACGLGVYRDDLFGPGYAGNTFTCEPVNLLLHRLTLEPRGVTFAGRRAVGEGDREFLAATDGWFRPVQALTGPDGALWVVDMHRLVIEHPQWIPPEDLARLDVRAGHSMGRIFRIYPKGKKPRTLSRLDRLDTAGLVAALDSPNGPQRDLAQQLLVWKQEQAAVAALEALAHESPRAEARLHALCTLDGLGALRPATLTPALADLHPGVRRHAARLTEGRVAGSPALADALLRRVDDADPQVRLQLAYSFGAWNDPRAARALATLALRDAGDPFLLAAALSSVDKTNLAPFAEAVLAARGPVAPRLAEALPRLAAAFGDRDTLRRVLGDALAPAGKGPSARQLDALAGVLDALEHGRRVPGDLLDADQQKALASAVGRARSLLTDAAADEALRLAATRLLGRRAEDRLADIEALSELLVPRNTPALQASAVAALARVNDDRVPAELLARWDGLGPGLRPQVLDALLRRDAWARRLLAALEEKAVRPGEVDAARRELLLRHKDPELRRLARQLLSGGSDPDRKKVLDAYRDVLTMRGERPRGRDVFAKRCATCHRLEGVGHEVGPDLGSMSGKPLEALLVAILDPNQAVDGRYQQYLATTRGGRVFSGVLAAETAAAVTLRGQDGQEQVITRADIEELRGTGRSLMPEGLEKDLTRQELADVITYVAGGGPPRKQVAGNAPTAIKPGAGGVLTLSAASCEIYGGEITFEGEFGNVGLWHGGDDHVVWTVELPAAGRYEVALDYACDDGSAGSRFELTGGGPVLKSRVEGTGGWGRYRQVKVGTVTLAAGVNRLTLRPDGKPDRALLDLRALRLTPARAP
jgi:putative membrane-bound dehydrogenase-like protein